jgi:hypothetical protein
MGHLEPDRSVRISGASLCFCAGFRPIAKAVTLSVFLGQWIVTLLLLGIVMAHLYAWARPNLGPGPKTALKIGFLVGFAAGFPENFAQASWSPLARAFPTAWMLEMWVGAIFATLVAGYLYRE